MSSVKPSFSVRLLFLYFNVSFCAIACGPFFPTRMLLSDDSYLLRGNTIEKAFFELEHEPQLQGVHRAKLPEDSESLWNCSSVVSMRRQTRETAEVEFKTALGYDLELSSVQRESLLIEFTDLRKYLEINSNDGSASASLAKLSELADLFSAKGIEEFELYLRGAIAYGNGDLELAVESWLELLEIPQGERPFRSVWAAYMLGRAIPAESKKWFILTRQLASQGFMDSTGLAAASLGWEARFEMEAGRYEEALDLYIRQYRSGYESAVQSLDMLAKRILADPRYDLREATRSRSLNRLITSKLVQSWERLYDNGRQDPRLGRWLDALSLDSEINVEQAGRLSLLAYRNGDDISAAAWASRSRPDDALAIWIQSKLTLKEGKVEEGLELLRIAKQKLVLREVESENENGKMELNRMLGTLLTGSADFEGAIVAFLESAQWLDAAYLAETVLSSNQLLDFVEHQLPLIENEGLLKGKWHGTNLRLLCGRRLVREGRYDEAACFFDESSGKKLEKLARTLDRANDTSLTKEARARAYWEVALIERRHGMELFATELYPDYACFNGNFQMEDERKIRINFCESPVNSPSEVEIERIQVSMETVVDRYHYRFLAAGHAWKAAELLPDGDPRTAIILASAGNWLKYQDPDAADPFFKALVIRCPRTPLGEKAMQRNWFPEVNEEIEW